MRAGGADKHLSGSRGASTTYHGLDRGLQILLDTFAVEDVSTLRLDSVLGELVTKSTNSTLSSLILEEHADVVLAAKNKVRVACHLTHTGEPEGGC